MQPHRAKSPLAEDPLRRAPALILAFLRHAAREITASVPEAADPKVVIASRTLLQRLEADGSEEADAALADAEFRLAVLLMRRGRRRTR